MKKLLLFLLFIAAVLVAILTPARAQQTSYLDSTTTHKDHIPLAAVPQSTTDVLVPAAGTPSRVIVRSMYFVNTNASTVVTVTVTCKTTTTVLVKAALPGVTAGGNHLLLQMPADGISCEGGTRWIADGAGVNGYMTGSY